MIRTILAHARNLALALFAASLLGSDASAAPICDPSPNGQCICCGSNCCQVICGDQNCNCCSGSCSGNHCY